MKQHANIGADLLGSIQFPYPVVPIVRHHHESWDGSGYPDGIKGVAIPLGARILSVVDCFDALTSDRPYRPRLSTEDAIAILVQRRGTMYDPLVVDKFIEAQQHLSEIAEDGEAETEALESIASKLRLVAEPEVAAPNAVDIRLPLKALTLLRSIKPAPSGLTIEDIGLLISNRMSKLTTFSSMALFVMNENEHSIKCRYADGRLSSLVDAPEIQLGEKLSGWVAAHRTAIWNSDATLDLSAEVAHGAGVGIGSSIPLVHDDVLIGTVTLYAGAGDEIGLEQRMLIQALAPQLAKVLASSIAHDEIAAIDGRGADDRETIYSVLDALISTRSQHQEKSDVDRLTIVRVEWHVESDGERSESMRATLERAIASATNLSGHVIRLGSSDVLVVAPVKHLLSAGLEPTSQRVARRTNIVVTEVANSLELRETLGLTVTNEAPASPEKRLIH
jgi:hypothetical protein